MRFRSINDHAAAERAQQTHEEAGFPAEQRPAPADLWTAEQVPADAAEPTSITTPWGTALVLPGDWIFTHPEGWSVGVHNSDVETVWEQVT